MKRNVVFICLIIPLLSMAQTASEVFEVTWKGYSKSRSAETESGYFYCSEKLYEISFNDDDNTFSGKSLTGFTLDGVLYESLNYISGTFNPDDYSVTIQTGSVIRQDELPEGLYWINTTINLTVYSDEEHEGYYLLSGKASNQSYSDEFYEVASYPY